MSGPQDYYDSDDENMGIDSPENLVIQLIEPRQRVLLYEIDDNRNIKRLTVDGAYCPPNMIDEIFGSPNTHFDFPPELRELTVRKLLNINNPAGQPLTLYLPPLPPTLEIFRLRFTDVQSLPNLGECVHIRELSINDNMNIVSLPDLSQLEHENNMSLRGNNLRILPRVSHRCVNLLCDLNAINRVDYVPHPRLNIYMQGNRGAPYTQEFVDRMREIYRLRDPAAVWRLDNDLWQLIDPGHPDDPTQPWINTLYNSDDETDYSEDDLEYSDDDHDVVGPGPGGAIYHDNVVMVPPFANLPNIQVQVQTVDRIDENLRVFDPVGYEELPLHTVLTGDDYKDSVVLQCQQSYALVYYDQLRTMTNYDPSQQNDKDVVFACLSLHTVNVSNTKLLQPLLAIRKLGVVGGCDGFLPVSYIKHMLDHPEKRLFRLLPDPNFPEPYISTVSFDALFRRDPDWTSASHCQEGQGGARYIMEEIRVVPSRKRGRSRESTTPVKAARPTDASQTTPTPTQPKTTTPPSAPRRSVRLRTQSAGERRNTSTGGQRNVLTQSAGERRNPSTGGHRTQSTGVRQTQRKPRKPSKKPTRKCRKYHIRKTRSKKPRP